MDRDILIFLIINIVILVAGGTIIYYLINDNIAECVSNPLPFAAEQYEKQYGEETYGIFYLGKERYSFNSSGVFTQPLI